MSSMSEETVLPIPNLRLPEHHYVLSIPSLSRLHERAREQLLAGVRADTMGPYLRALVASGALPADDALLKELEATNKTELDEFKRRQEEAEKLEGETDVVEILRDRANYLTKIGDKVRVSSFILCYANADVRQDGALEAQKLALEKTVGAGQKIDIVLTLIRLGFFFGDNTLITEQLAKAEEFVCHICCGPTRSLTSCVSRLIDQGGDWDRRNRLKVYRGVHLCSIRQFASGGELLLDRFVFFLAVLDPRLHQILSRTLAASTSLGC
jgi:26S proteasome regulatory subunit N7